MLAAKQGMNLIRKLRQQLGTSKLIQTAVRALYMPKKFVRNRKARTLATCGTPESAATRVLVVMDAGIGNAILATPLVQAIRMHWPASELTIVTPAGGLFDDWQCVDRVVEASSIDGNVEYEHVFVGWGAKLNGGVERAVQNSRRIYRAKKGLPRYVMRHEVDFNMQLIRDFGYQGPCPPLYVGYRHPELSELKIGGHPRIAIVPGGKNNHMWRHKNWLFFPQLIEALLCKYHSGLVYIVGQPDDDIKGAVPRSERVIDLRGRLSLPEAAGCLRAMDVAIGNDCGPMHIADAMRTPSIMIFGPTCEIKNGPRNRGIALTGSVACRPCQFDPPLRDSCADPICQKQITSERVLSAMDELLND